MIEAITQAFRTPTAKEMAQRELANAERELLQAHTLRDYATSTVAYHQARIDRLRVTLACQGGALGAALHVPLCARAESP